MVHYGDKDSQFLGNGDSQSGPPGSLSMGVIGQPDFYLSLSQEITLATAVIGQKDLYLSLSQEITEITLSTTANQDLQMDLYLSLSQEIAEITLATANQDHQMDLYLSLYLRVYLQEIILAEANQDHQMDLYLSILQEILATIMSPKAHIPALLETIMSPNTMPYTGEDGWVRGRHTSTPVRVQLGRVQHGPAHGSGARDYMGCSERAGFQPRPTQQQQLLTLRGRGAKSTNRPSGWAAGC